MQTNCWKKKQREDKTSNPVKIKLNQIKVKKAK